MSVELTLHVSFKSLSFVRKISSISLIIIIIESNIKFVLDNTNNLKFELYDFHAEVLMVPGFHWPIYFLKIMEIATDC